VLLHQYAQCTQESPGIPAGNQGQIDAAMLQHGRVVRSDLAWDQQGTGYVGMYIYIICVHMYMFVILQRMYMGKICQYV
jgi:hypothetical protein